MRNLLSVVPVETTPECSCDCHDGNRSEEPLQTLHGLFLLWSGCLLLLFVILVDVPGLMREVDSNQHFGANFLDRCCQNHTDEPVLGDFIKFFNEIRSNRPYLKQRWFGGFAEGEEPHELGIALRAPPNGRAPQYYVAA